MGHFGLKVGRGWMAAFQEGFVMLLESDTPTTSWWSSPTVAPFREGKGGGGGRAARALIIRAHGWQEPSSEWLLICMHMAKWSIPRPVEQVMSSTDQTPTFFFAFFFWERMGTPWWGGAYLFHEKQFYFNFKVSGRVPSPHWLQHVWHYTSVKMPSIQAPYHIPNTKNPTAKQANLQGWWNKWWIRGRKPTLFFGNQWGPYD